MQPFDSYVHGIDTSHWNVVPPPSVLTANNIKFVISKAGQGLTLDANFASTQATMKAANILFASYWFMDYMDGTKQADAYLNAVPNGPYNLDVEANVTLSQLLAAIAEIYGRTGLYPAIYTSKYYIQAIGGTKNAILAMCDLWLADYSATSFPPACEPWLTGAKPVTFWQNGSSVTGGSNLDNDWWQGTYDGLVSYWTAKSAVVPETTPIMVEPSIPANLQNAPGAYLRVDDCVVAASQWMWKFIMAKGGISVPNATIDSWTRETTLMTNDNGLTIEQGIALAANHGAYLIQKDRATLQDVLDQLLIYGLPVMAIGWEGSFPDSPGVNHCICAIGASNRRIWVMDPLLGIRAVAYAQFDAFMNVGSGGPIAIVDPTQIGIEPNMGSTQNREVIAQGGLNERKGPGTGYALAPGAGTATKPLPFPVGWVIQVNNPQSTPGWYDETGTTYFVSADPSYTRLTTLPPTVKPPTSTTGTPQVTLAVMNIRTNPTTIASIVKTVSVGTNVTVNLDDKRTDARSGARFVIITEGTYVGNWIAFDNPTVPMVYLGNPTAPITPPNPKPTVKEKIWGININQKDPTGNPSAQTLTGVGHVRWVLSNVIDNKYAGTIQQAIDFYKPLVQSYNANGIKSNAILCQSLYWGNGPWDNGNWDAYITGFASACTQVVTAFKGLIDAYEIWNEGDIAGQPTSIYIPPATYSKLLTAAYNAIKAVDPDAKVVTGGLAGPDPLGYMTQVRDANGVISADAIGYHPYGQNAPGGTAFGWPQTIASNTQAFVNRFGKPVWITEIGVARVDVNDTSLWPIIANYMQAIFNWAKATGTQVQWFAWSDNMDRAGIVNNAQQPKNPIKSTFDSCVLADKL